MLPIMVLANPGDDAKNERRFRAEMKAGGHVSPAPKRPQTAAQRRASMANLRKAREANAPKKAPKKKAAPKGAAKKKTVTKTSKETTVTNPPKERTNMATAKQIAAARKNIKKAQAANKHGGKTAKHKPRKNPSKPRHYAKTSAPKRARRRRNPEGGRGSAILQVGGGAVLGGLSAGGADYLMTQYAATATPGRKAIIHTTAGLVVGVGGAAIAPGAKGFFGGVAGSFVGLGVANGLRWAFAGSSSSSSQTQVAPSMGAIVPATPAHGVRAHGNHAPVRELRPAMRGVVITDPNALRAVVPVMAATYRGPRPTAR